MSKTKIVPETIKVTSEGVFEGVVKPSGNGAIINFLKRFIGRKVYIVLKRGDK